MCAFPIPGRNSRRLSGRERGGDQHHPNKQHHNVSVPPWKAGAKICFSYKKPACDTDLCNTQQWGLNLDTVYCSEDEGLKALGRYCCCFYCSYIMLTIQCQALWASPCKCLGQWDFHGLFRRKEVLLLKRFYWKMTFFSSFPNFKSTNSRLGKQQDMHFGWRSYP